MYGLQKPVTFFVGSDVSFNERNIALSLKEGNNFQNLRIDKRDYELTYIVMEKFDHYVINDLKVCIGVILSM